MELSNNALKIYRESLNFRRINNEDATPSTKCLHSYTALSQCVLQNKLSVLDQDAVRSQCPVEEWRTECPGALRRIHIERMYTRGLSRKLYTQEQLNKYMLVKNHFDHYGIVDPRY